MAETTIEWTNTIDQLGNSHPGFTFNPWSGCSKVNAGCQFCYAEVNRSVRIRGVTWGPKGKRIVSSPDYWQKPLSWNKKAYRLGVRLKVFCASLSDVFEEIGTDFVFDHKGNRIFRQFDENATLSGNPYIDAADHYRVGLPELRKDLFNLIDMTPYLDWLILTKRPQNIPEMWPNTPYPGLQGQFSSEPHPVNKYRPNVWLGTSISDQETANAMLPELLKCRDLSPVLFTSYEPALGPVDFTMIRDPNRFPGCAYFDVLRGRMIHEDDGNRWTKEPHLDQVIVGGESGPNARPYELDWPRQTIKQCAESGIACFHKQLGSFAWRKSDGGGMNVYFPTRDKKGGDPAEWPEDLRVRQFPVVSAG